MSPLTRSKRRKQGIETRALGEAEKSRKASINNVHYELLADIFQRVLFQTGISESSQEQLVNLMLVCQQWRNMALNTTQLWCELAFDVVGTRSEEEEIIRRCMLWFSRAKTLPLSIDIFFRRYKPSVMGPAFIEGDVHLKKEKLWDYLAGIPQLHRIRLCGPAVSCINEWFVRPRSALQYLIIEACLDVESVDMSGFRYRRYMDVAHAETMCVEDITRRGWPSTRPTTLTILSLHARVSSFFVLCLLEESPLLETCDLDMHPSLPPPASSVGYQGPAHNAVQGNFMHVPAFNPNLGNPFHGEPMLWSKLRGSNDVVPPKLRYLKLFNVIGDEQEGQDELARFLRTPKLRQLQLSNYCAEITHFFEKCFSGLELTLRNMDLRYLNIADNQLLNILRNYPNLSALTLHRLECLNGSFLDALQLDGSHSILSRLRTLDIYGNWKCFSDMALVRFIKDRAKSWKLNTAHGGTRTLEWALFKGWLFPELYVRYDAFNLSTKLLRTVKVEKVDAVNQE